MKEIQNYFKIHFIQKECQMTIFISICFHIQAHDDPCGGCIFPVLSAKRFLHGVLYIDVKYYGNSYEQQNSLSTFCNT